MRNGQALEIFTDGSCLGNPGPGGWAALIRDANGEQMLTGSERDTTNNRMELMAAIAALEAVAVGASIVLTTDSQYVQQGIKAWLPNWRARGWRTAHGKPVKNQDLWCRLDRAAAARVVSWRWVRGHVGHPENTRVDAAAYEAALDDHLSEATNE